MSDLAETDFKAELRTVSGAAELVATERRHHILTLRRRGMGPADIARTLGDHEQLQAAGLSWEPIQISAESVSRIIKRYLNQLETECAETRDELRTLENERLDELYRHWLPVAKSASPDAPKAAAICVRIMQRRAKLNGLDAPVKVDVHHTGSILHELGVDPDEIRRQRESFETAFGELPAPADVELSPDDVTELNGDDPENA